LKQKVINFLIFNGFLFLR